MLYPFIEGHTGWDITNEQWAKAGHIFRQIHEVVSPFGLESLRRELFDPAVYGRAVHSLEVQLLHADGREDAQGALGALWARHRPTLEALLISLTRLADLLREKSLPQVICHADLHPGNLLRNRAGQVFVVDWDDVMLAPKERDFIFTGEPGDAGTTPGSPFFEGYGHPNVNWTAITYYRFERIVQDVIEYTRHAFRPDLSEAAKEFSVDRFRQCFQGRVSRASQIAAAHIASELPAINW